jgi:hypothetical membrane protein
MTARTSPPSSVAFPVVLSRGVMLGGALWAASAVFFVAQAIGQAASTVPYSLATNLISDLGTTACGPDVCSPLHALVNGAFVVTGVCHAAGALASRRAWPRGLGQVGVGLLVVAGAGLVVAGIAPENLNPGVHAAGALGGLVSLNLGSVALGWSIRPAAPWLGRLVLAAGVVGLVGTGDFLAGLGAPGITERLADWPAAAMVVVLGVRLLLATTRGRRA